MVNIQRRVPVVGQCSPGLGQHPTHLYDYCGGWFLCKQIRNMVGFEISLTLCIMSIANRTHEENTRICEFRNFTFSILSRFIMVLWLPGNSFPRAGCLALHLHYSDGTAGLFPLLPLHTEVSRGTESLAGQVHCLTQHLHFIRATQTFITALQQVSSTSP